MVANPIQKKQRNSMLAGVAIGLIVGLIACILLYLFLTSNSGATPLSSGQQSKAVAVLNKAVKSGTRITSADYTTKKVDSSYAPTDAVTPGNDTVAKIDLSAGTILSSNMLTTERETMTKDLREQEYNMIALPTDLSAGEYIDIRLQLPDGGDFIVVSKKCVQKVNATTVWLKMNEEDTLVMSNAIVEYYIMAGSKLYATTYTDPGTQEAATPTYTPNATVTALINGNPNITSQIANGQGRFAQNLINIRNSQIKSQLSKYDDTGLENLETKLQEEIKNLKESREAYFGTLNAAR